MNTLPHTRMNTLPRLTDFPVIAIIQTAFIGDVALVLTLAQQIRILHPTGRLLLVTTPAAAPLAQCATALDEVLAFDKRKSHKGLSGLRQMAAQLQKREVACILAPHRSLRTTILTRLAGARHSVGFDRNAASFLYSQTVPYYADRHEIERNSVLLRAFAESSTIATCEQPIPTLAIPSALQDNVFSMLRTKGIDSPPHTNAGYVVLAPGSVWATKRWREEYFVEIARQLQTQGRKVVLVGGKDDAALCEHIAAASGSVSLAGATTLPEMAVILSNAQAVVCNDSAPTHIAGLVQCPTVAIFGPTVPAFGFAPRGERVRVVEHKHLSCRPCSPHGTNQCPLGTHECMKGVLPEQVMKALHEVLPPHDGILPNVPRAM